MGKAENLFIVGMLLICLISVVYCNLENDANVQESRTFGHHFLKRISFAIIPAAFVVGMITTLLGALTVVSIKSLGVGVILLVLTIGQMIARALPTAVPLTAATYPPAHYPLVY
ncbi:CLUMA_CG002000, isoform A [Clunio marinus]|uniref:CLUMA_CG002000, isoform A n=1 Tax=Clunio marinus TaxID=568069 RepID=A0A1J1HJX4_9DIPT|nr:CLUMA_CG002000, isoform A [Clunio marinus]